MKNYSIKAKLFFLTVLFFGVFGLAKNTWAATLTAVNCSQSEVQEKVTVAVRGDTVIVPAGSCTWTSSLNITKSIILKGAGIDATTITGNINSTDTYIIIYTPSDPTADSEVLMRITGFTFKAIDTPNIRTTNNGITYYWRNGGIKAYMGNDIPVPVKKLRIDNNKFYDFMGRTASKNNLCINIAGTFYGVMDNNIFDGDTTIGFGHPKPWYRWNNNTFALGTAENFYLEDNTFIKRPIYYYYEDFLQANMSASYSFRYNTITFSGLQDGWDWFYGLDLHHQGSGSLAPFGGEVYGNRWNVLDGKTFELGEYRSGQGLTFYNKIIFPTNVGNSTFRLYDQFRDDIDAAEHPTWLLSTTCPAGTLYAGVKTCGVDGRPQYIHDTYVWNNRKGLAAGSQTLLDTQAYYCSPAISSGVCSIGTLPLRENTDWWQDSASFNGASGIGCGTLANRPTTCTKGVGYWATNQSCSEVPYASIGANPAAPISGTLYRCDSAGKWQVYYTPYAYPHPLRGGTTNTAPAAPMGVRVI